MEIRKIESKYSKLLGQQALEKLKIYIPMERGLFSQHNKEVNELIEIISKGLNADQHFQPTLKEVKKEWEDRGYKFNIIRLINDDSMYEIIIQNEKEYPNNIHILISLQTKKINCLCNIPYDVIHLLSKTLKALEVDDAKD